MKTIINDLTVNIPKMKDCRIDYRSINGSTYTVLVDFINNNALYIEAGVKGLKAIYSEFKFIASGELTISQTFLFNRLGYDFKPLDNVTYSHY